MSSTTRRTFRKQAATATLAGLSLSVPWPAERKAPAATGCRSPCPPWVPAHPPLGPDEHSRRLTPRATTSSGARTGTERPTPQGVINLMPVAFVGVTTRARGAAPPGPVPGWTRPIRRALPRRARTMNEARRVCPAWTRIARTRNSTGASRLGLPVDAAGKLSQSGPACSSVVSTALTTKSTSRHLREIIERYHAEGFTDNQLERARPPAPSVSAGNCLKKFRERSGKGHPAREELGRPGVIGEWIRWNYDQPA